MTGEQAAEIYGVTMDSSAPVKEPGAIEYGADILPVLQPRDVGDAVRFICYPGFNCYI